MSIFVDNVAYRPFKYKFAVEAEKKHRIDMNWHEDQIDLSDDLRQFHSKDGMATATASHETNKYILEKLIMLFTEMDVQVGGGYAKLLAHVKNNEIRTMWFTFAAREVTHQRSYALAAETFGFTNSDWSEFKQYEEMQGKIDLMCQKIGDLNDPMNFAKQLAVVFLGEGISLFGAFAVLINMKRNGLMMGFNTINEWSLNDEHEHVENNIKVFQDVIKGLSSEEQAEVKQFVRETIHAYVKAEHRFLDLVFKLGDQDKLTKADAKQFINYLGRYRYSQMYKIENDLENPLDWMEYLLAGNRHTNFFENKVTGYSHHDLAGEIDYSVYTKVYEEM